MSVAAYDLPTDTDLLTLECDMDRVWSRGCKILEDACQAVADVTGYDADALADDKAAFADILTDRFHPACEEMERRHGIYPDMPWRDANTVPPIPTRTKEAA